MADARLLLLRSRNSAYGGVVEMVVWSVPLPVPPSRHAFKYRLVFVRDGQRLVGYDNERGKGDHRHIGERELKYRFTDIEPWWVTSCATWRNWHECTRQGLECQSRRDAATGW